MLLLFSGHFQRNASRSCAARGYICSFADVLKFADGPAPAPVGAGVPGSPHRRTARYQIPAHFRLTLCRGRRPRRPVRFSSMSPTGRVPRPRARVTFGRSPKSDQKRCLKPQVSRLPARLGYVKNLSPRTPRKPKCCTSSYNESLTILLSLPLPRSARKLSTPALYSETSLHSA